MDKDSQEKAVPKEELLQREIFRQNQRIESLVTSNQMLHGDLIFWKKLALTNLGVDTQKINELVHSGAGIGAMPMGNTTMGRF